MGDCFSSETNSLFAIIYWNRKSFCLIIVNLRQIVG